MKNLFAPIFLSQKKELWRWCSDLVRNGNSYNRTNQTIKKRIENLFFGKVAELVFYRAILLKGLIGEEKHQHLTESSLEVFKGRHKGDNGDFNINGLELDIKTIPKPHLTQILIPKDQPPKPYYVGVKLVWEDGKVLGGNVLGVVDRQTATKTTFNHRLKKCEAWAVGEGAFDLNTLINLIILNKSNNNDK